MKRDISILEDQKFDAIVIGGGIHGATAYHQLAKAGLRTAIIEKGDFGEATSANSLKILHGGLRYLQHLNFKRMRESIKSRWHYMDMAPNLIKPMPCLMATKGSGIQSKFIMSIALKMFDLISWDRNRNVPEQNKVGKGKVIAKKDILKIAPGIDPQGLTGAALWYDDLILHTERMTLEFVKEGSDKYHGIAANYVKAEEIVKDGEKILGVRVKDRFTGQVFFIKARSVINAAGPWAGSIESPGKITSTPEDLAKAVNIVVNRPLFDGYGIGLSGRSNFVDQDAVIKRGNRLFFFAPWKSCTIIGTTYRYYRQDTDSLKVTPEDIDELLEEVNGIYPVAKVTRDEITFAHAGLVPAHKGINFDHTTTPQVIKHSRIIDHQEYDNIKGLFTIEGVKYTTAPEIAHQLIALFQNKGLLVSDLPTVHNTAKSQRRVNLTEAGIKRLNSVYPHIYENFGKNSGAVYQIMEDIPGTNEILAENPTITKAEVIYTVQEEMCLSLLDLVLRRTEVALFKCPDKETLDNIAHVMAEELGWDESKIDEEISSVAAYFANTLSINWQQECDTDTP